MKRNEEAPPTAGSPAMIEFCEQVNPRGLLERRQTRPFPDMLRVQESWVAAAEKRALLWLAARTPRAVNSDHLTALGLAAQMGGGACYALAAHNRWALVGVIACLALNWLGDSLDGTLARARQRLRPRYGFYVDHIVDSFGALALMSGLALSGYMHPGIAFGLLVGFLLLSIQSYLATHALGEFRLSFWRFGPTELRILLAVGNLALLWKPIVHLFDGQYRLFDVGGFIGLVGMALMLVFFTLQNTIRLYREERVTESMAAGFRELGECGHIRGSKPPATPPNSSRLVRWLKFNFVGAVGIGVQFAALFLLRSVLHFDYLVATALAVEAAVMHNFIWHEQFTWVERTKPDRTKPRQTNPDREQRNRIWSGKAWLISTHVDATSFLARRSLTRLMRFHLANGAVSLLGNLALMKVMVGYGQINYLVANAIAIVMCSLANFLVSDEWVFGDSRTHDAQ